jgi:hypothetical protein
VEKEPSLIGSAALTSKMARMNLGEMSPEDKKKSMYGDLNQGSKLVSKKITHSSKKW